MNQIWGAQRIPLGRRAISFEREHDSASDRQKAVIQASQQSVQIFKPSSGDRFLQLGFRERL
jgi:hypothetical protein